LKSLKTSEAKFFEVSSYKMIMTDQVFLRQLVLPACIGVLAHEKVAPQDIVLDIALEIDIRKAALSDNLNDTLDYAQLAQQLATHCLHRHVELVETLAEQLAIICLQDKRVQRATLTLGKPHALANAASVGVHITREQNK
jgi:dihydroneopterin aldolase